MNTNSRRRDLHLRKMYCILLSAICFSILSTYMLMNIIPSPNIPFIERSDVDDLKVAAGIIETDASTSLNQQIDIRPPIRTNDNLQIPRCHPPNLNTSSWIYYNALVDTNLNTATKALNLTDNPSRTAQQQKQKRNDTSNNNSSITAIGYSKYIPHRLIFTHKQNLFNCSISASSTTSSPHLYTLAENAKATVNAYRKIWSDLEVVFLTDQDCLQALNEVEPDLIPFFHKEVGTCFISLS